jgi:hypothetical protein
MKNHQNPYWQDEEEPEPITLIAIGLTIAFAYIIIFNLIFK